MEAVKNNAFKLRPMHIIALAVLAIALVVIYMSVSSGAQVVANGDNVSVYYTGAFTNGTVFDSNMGGQPLQFTVGGGGMIEGFNNAVIGMTLNETKNVTIPVNEAYGEVNPALIVHAPASEFGNITVSAGNVVVTGSGQRGLITAVNATTVTIDFNPALAGKTLMFEIKVVGIKKK
jgi:peptidylprolyl isomerase